jgi:hypothetical protein
VLAARLLVAGVLAHIEPSAGQTSGLEVESRHAIYSVDDRTSAPHNEVHFPYLHESGDGRWYMTLREGPHASSLKKFGLTCQFGVHFSMYSGYCRGYILGHRRAPPVPDT